MNQYPVGDDDRLVRGDPWTIVVPVTVNGAVPDDLADWAWRAQVRSTPDAPVIATFACTTQTASDAGVPDGEIPGVGPDDPVLVMHLTGNQTANVNDGDGFDLEVTGPSPRTLWRAVQLRVERDYSHV